VPKAKTSPPSPPAPPAPTSPQWVNWQCDICKGNNRTRTRKGTRYTCPKCGHVQLSEEGKTEHARRLKERERWQRDKRRQPSRVRVQGDTPPAPDPPPTTPPPGRGKRPAAPAPATSPPSFLDRLLGYD
jgi:predicted RNA-binding Zn-ribbon protein involved in translation (DUF1610 family)